MATKCLFCKVSNALIEAEKHPSVSATLSLSYAINKLTAARQVCKNNDACKLHSSYEAREVLAERLEEFDPVDNYLQVRKKRGQWWI